MAPWATLPGVGHLMQALLALRPQLQVTPATSSWRNSSATGLLQVGLQLGMLQAGGLGGRRGTQPVDSNSARSAAKPSYHPGPPPSRVTAVPAGQPAAR